MTTTAFPGETDCAIAPIYVTIARFYRIVIMRVATPYHSAPQISAESAVWSVAIGAQRLFKPISDMEHSAAKLQHTAEWMATTSVQWRNAIIVSFRLRGGAWLAAFCQTSTREPMVVRKWPTEVKGPQKR